MAPSRDAGAAGGPASSAGRRQPTRSSRPVAQQVAGRSTDPAPRNGAIRASGDRAAGHGMYSGYFANPADDVAEQQAISQSPLDQMQSMYVSDPDWATGGTTAASCHPTRYQLDTPEAASYPKDWGYSGGQAPQQAAAYVSRQQDHSDGYLAPIDSYKAPPEIEAAGPSMLSSSVVITPAVVAAAKRGFLPIGSLPVGGAMPTAIPAAAAPAALQSLLAPAPQQRQQQQQQQPLLPPPPRHMSNDIGQPPFGLPPPSFSLQPWPGDSAAVGMLSSSAPAQQRPWADADKPGARIPAYAGESDARAASMQQPAAAAEACLQPSTGRRRGNPNEQLQVTIHRRQSHLSGCPSRPAGFHTFKEYLASASMVPY